MVLASLKRRLERLEAQKAHEEGTRFFLCFAGRDAEVVIDDLARKWTRLPGESVDAFHERTRADRPPFGFVCLNAVNA